MISKRKRISSTTDLPVMTPVRQVCGEKRRTQIATILLWFGGVEFLHFTYSYQQGIKKGVLEGLLATTWPKVCRLPANNLTQKFTTFRPI